MSGPIPPRYVFVWMGAGFHYPFLLAVASVTQADPGAEVVVLLHGERPASAWFSALRQLGDVRIHIADPEELFAGLPSSAGAYRRVLEAVPTDAHSARSNLLRYGALHQWGGVYLDFDVIVRRGLRTLAPGPFVGSERVWVHDRPRVEHRWSASMLPGTIGWALTWAARRTDSMLLGGRARSGDRLGTIERRWSSVQANNAVIGSAAGTPFTTALLERALELNPTVRFALGPSLLDDTVRSDPSLAAVLPPSILYPVAPADSFRYFEDRFLELPPETALIHYVASNHSDLLAGIGPGDPRSAAGRSVFWQLVRLVEDRLPPGLRVLPGNGSFAPAFRPIGRSR